MKETLIKTLVGITIFVLLVVAEQKIAKAIDLFDYSCDAEITGISSKFIKSKITITIPGVIPNAITGTQITKPDVYIYTLDGQLITSILNSTGEKIILKDPIVYQGSFQIDYTTPLFAHLAIEAGKNVQNILADVVAGNNDLSYWEIGIDLVAKLVFRDSIMPPISIQFVI